MRYKHAIGLGIRARRTQLEMTQPDLAELTGLSEGAIGQIERGAAAPRFENLEKIAEALDTTVLDILIHASIVQEGNKNRREKMADIFKDLPNLVDDDVGLVAEIVSSIIKRRRRKKRKPRA